MLPTFKTSNDIVNFLSSGGDVWCRPMVEEFIEMCGSDLDLLDLHELNAWISSEMQSLGEGYEDYFDN